MERTDNRTSNSNPRWITIVFGTLSVIAVWIIVFVGLNADRARELSYAREVLSDFARILAEHSELGLDTAARLADVAKSEFEAGRVHVPDGLLKRFEVGGDHIVQLAVADAQGAIVYSNFGPSKANIRDRPHFKVHVERNSSRPFVSVPVLGRVSGRWTVQVVRRMSGPNGEFQGIVVVSIDPFFYTRLYKDLDIGSQGVVGMIGMDGVVRSRTIAGKEQGTGVNMAGSLVAEAVRANLSGTLMATSAADERKRLYAYRRVKGYDLAIVVGKSEQDILATFYIRQKLYLALAIALTLASVMGVSLIIKSIRRQEALMDGLDEARHKAESVNELKSRFVTMVSHEIRTPLTGVLGYSELLANADLAPDLREYAKMLHASTEQISQIVDEIVDVQRADEAALRIPVTETDPVPIIRGVTEMYAPAADVKQLCLSVDIDETAASLRVLADARRLTQVIGNLVNNAIKFTSTGGVNIHAHTDGGIVCIDVADTGVGIPEDAQAKIFERFSQGNENALSEGGGLGLGLTYAKLLIELMGGRLELLASNSSGTIFRVTLPPAERMERRAVEHSLQMGAIS